MKKCIYCKVEIDDECVIDFCDKCGKNVWGEKMFNTIVKNMETARSNGDLCHDNVLGGVQEQTNSFRNF